jgi:hypothetical protein
MTKRERAAYVADFKERRTSKIVLAQSGYQEQFGDVKQNSVDTIKQKPVVDDDGAFVAHENNVDPNLKGEIDGVISAIQKAIETVGDGNPEMSDSLKQLLTWASTSDVFRKTPGSPVVRKSVVNRNDDGTTSPPMHYPNNSESSKPGPRKTITAAELASLPENAKALFAKYQKLGLVDIAL